MNAEVSEWCLGVIAGVCRAAWYPRIILRTGIFRPLAWPLVGSSIQIVFFTSVNAIVNRFVKIKARSLLVGNLEQIFSIVVFGPPSISIIIFA